jgi:short-subunit dehydrogenase
VIARKDKVIATARNHATIANLHNETGSKEDQLRTLQLDLTDSTENVNARVAEAVGYWGRIDVLVNNASFGTPTLLEEGGSVTLFAVESLCD